MAKSASILSTVSSLLMVWLISRSLLRRFSRSKRVGISRLRTLFTREVPMRWSMDKYAQEGYDKHHSKGVPFITKVFGEDYWVLPPKYLQDVKSAPAKSLSFFRALSESFNMQASVGDLYESTVEITVVTKFLNSQFTRVVPLLADEAEFAIEKELGNLQEWKSFPGSELCARLIHRTTSRILVGPDLCRDEEYLDISARFSQTLFMHGTLWNFVALGPLRRLFAWLTIGGHKRDLDGATRMLLPQIRRRLADRENGVDISARYPDMLQWLLDTPASIPGDDEPVRQAHHLLHLTFAASSASGVLVTQALFQLLMLPEYVQPLRNELKRALGEHGGYTDKAMTSMVLMDSFLRETMRMYPAGSLTCARSVMEPSFRFHDGFELRRGQKIIFPSLAIHRDPANYCDPSTFDGYRFLKKRGGEQAGPQRSTAASTVDSTFLQFGYGAHACPGRFYAVRKAKIVLGHLLQQYDFKWDGEVTSRPPGIAIEAQMVANPHARVLFKSR